MPLFYFLIKNLVLESLMLEELLATGINSGDSPVGQMTWTVPGSYQWVVPDGVETVCCVVIGAGSRGTSTKGSPWSHNGMGGYGGNLRYQNNIPVTPGDVIPIVVGRGPSYVSNTTGTEIPRLDGTPSSAFGIKAHSRNNAALDSNHAGFIGGSYDTTGYNKMNLGGGAASFTANGISGTGYGRNIITGATVSRNGYDGGSAGGGGAAFGSITTGGAAGTKSRIAGAGGHGAVRIIWGPNRAYPSLNITDM